jgi:hypothetical protein
MSAMERRYARHLQLPGVGREGQRRIEAASVEVRGEGLEGWVARRYLEAAGVGEVKALGGPIEGPAWATDELREETSGAVTRGAIEALRRLREALERR